MQRLDCTLHLVSRVLTCIIKSNDFVTVGSTLYVMIEHLFAASLCFTVDGPDATFLHPDLGDTYIDVNFFFGDGELSLLSLGSFLSSPMSFERQHWSE